MSWPFSFKSICCRIFFLLRWFGADTVVAVLIVQLFLMKSFQVSLMGYLWGFGVMTSLFYMVDRSIDAIVYGEKQYERHRIYATHRRWLSVSILGLTLPCVIFWVCLPFHIQMGLMGSGVIFCIHMTIMGRAWYAPFKPMMVSLVFTCVMSVFYMNQITPWHMGFIFGSTLLNGLVHKKIENNGFLPLRIIWGVFIVTGGVMLACMGTYQSLFGWLLAGVAYAWLIHHRPWYWYEWGECVYSMPFLWGYVLI